MSYYKKRKQAFKHAFEGLFAAFKEEAHLKIHAIATALVSGFGLFFNISRLDWLILLLCCALVTGAELFNTAIEKLCDVVSPEQNPAIKFVKDVAAAAVLVFVIMAVMAGIFVFYPYVFTP